MNGKDSVLKNFLPVYRDCIHEKCTHETRIRLQLIIEFYISKEDQNREKESQHPRLLYNSFLSFLRESVEQSENRLI
jgi:hypothetical protein